MQSDKFIPLLAIKIKADRAHVVFFVGMAGRNINASVMIVERLNDVDGFDKQANGRVDARSVGRACFRGHGGYGRGRGVTGTKTLPLPGDAGKA